MIRVMLAALALAGCRQEQHETRRIAPAGGEALPVTTSGITAGAPQPVIAVDNPFEGNARAVQEGKQLFGWFNCAGCHGAIGGGGMGPPLRDADWIYGGSSLQILHSIIEGRPNGMPSFRGIPQDALWKLIAFVRSLGEPPAEEPGSISSQPEQLQREHGAAEEPHGAR